MPHECCAALVARLEVLERSHRRVRRLGGALLLVLAGVAVMGQARPRGLPLHGTVEVRRLVLRDDGGRIGAQLGWDPDGTLRFALQDPGGARRLVLSLAATSLPGVSLLAADGKTTVASLLVGLDQAPGLALFDGAGRPRAVMALFRQRAPGPAPLTGSAPALALYGEDGRTHATLRVGAASAAGLELGDRDGRARIEVRTGTDGVPGIEMRDGQDQRRVSLGVLGDGTPTLNLFGQEGRPRVTLALVPASPSLAIADRDGKVVWTAP